MFRKFEINFYDNYVGGKEKLKAVYESPRMMVQPFVPDEYVAACGDSGVVYKFKCDAGGGVYGSVYEETNGIPGLRMVCLARAVFMRVIRLMKQILVMCLWMGIIVRKETHVIL